jgi:hypothetical protein
MRMALLTVTSVIVLFGCSGTSKSVSRGDTLTVRQRDSVFGASQLPGAQGIRGALRATDSAAARRSREERGGD